MSKYPIAVKIIGSNEIPIMSRHHTKCLKQSETSDNSYGVQQNKDTSSYISDCSDTNHQYIKIDLKQFENSHPHILRLGPPLIEVKPYMRFMYTNILGAFNEPSRLDALNSLETEQLCNKV